MRYNTIIYARTIPTGSYANEKLGVEIEIEEGETPEQAFAQAKELIDKIHKENNPHLYGVRQALSVAENNAHNLQSSSEPEYKTAIQLLQEKKDGEIDGYIAAINLAENQKILNLYSKQVERNNDPSNPKHIALKAAYETRTEQLKQTT